MKMYQTEKIEMFGFYINLEMIQHIRFVNKFSNPFP